MKLAEPGRMRSFSMVLALAVLGTPLACAAHRAGQPDPRVAITKAFPGTTIDDVHRTPIPGLFEVTRGTNSAFVSANGRYAITGDLYDLRTNVDLSQQQRRHARLKLLAGVPDSQMLIYGAKDSPYTVTVFTDVNCAYCRKFHSEIGQYNRLGIRVRYLFFPRTGPNTASWIKAEQVWCSPHRKQALTRVRLGEALHVKPCAHTPVPQDYELARELGLVGTPSIILSNGALITGYVSPTDLAQTLSALHR